MRNYIDITTGISQIFKNVYGWMAGGLAVSGLVAYQTVTSGLWQKIINGPTFWTLAIVEILMVVVLSLCIEKIPGLVAGLLFLGYAALNGLTLSVILLAYTTASVVSAFFITAGMFCGLALFGTVTKSDLSGIGSICGMALWGLIIALVVNIFLGSCLMDFIVSICGVVIFTGLTMYDAQKIKQMAEQEATMDSETVSRLSVLGALSLYLDFINLFIYILRLVGKVKK